MRTPMTMTRMEYSDELRAQSAYVGRRTCNAVRGFVLVAALVAPSHGWSQPRAVPAVDFRSAPISQLAQAAASTAIDSTTFDLTRERPLPSAEPLMTVRAPAPRSARKAPWVAPVASFLVPGSGQALLGQQRSVGYVVAEGFLLIRALRANHDAITARTEYRRLASEVARSSFSAERPNGPWSYYETLEEYASSGAYELNPGGKFAPETDLQTYNGLKWLQARQTFWADPAVAPAESSPEYQRAVAFYQSRAYGGSFRWSWRDHQLEQAQYIQTIHDANRSEQHRTSAVGLVVANHLVSMIDAYINVRVRRYGGAGLGALSVRTDLQPENGIGGGYRASLNATLPLPRRVSDRR